MRISTTEESINSLTHAFINHRVRVTIGKTYLDAFLIHNAPNYREFFSEINTQIALLEEIPPKKLLLTSDDYQGEVDLRINHIFETISEKHPIIIEFLNLPKPT